MIKVRKSGFLQAIPLLIIIFPFSYPAFAKYSGGTGESNDPYQIATAEDLMLLGDSPEDYGKHFILTDDIDLDPNLPGRKVFDKAVIAVPTSVDVWDKFIGTPFNGVINGNGHTISHLTISTEDIFSQSNRYYFGLFGELASDAVVRDLGIINISITGSNYYVGGLVGCNKGDVTRCYSTGVVSGSSYIGGLVGWNEGKVTNCYSMGTVNGIGGGPGIQYYIGGLVGKSSGKIINCYARSNVLGKYNVGGLVGYNDFGIISYCYSSGNVSGWNSTGGLIGTSLGSRIYYSFWDVETSGQQESDGGNGKTTAEMQDPHTFINAGWDFVGQTDGPHDIWGVPAGGGYPILWWQLPSELGLPSFAGGMGTANNPYLISTAQHLNSIGHNPKLMEAYFKLTNDIDLEGTDFYIIGNSVFPFIGVFEGNGHIISNFNYTSTDEDNIGLFGYVDGIAQIKNVGLLDPNISLRDGDFVGSLVGCLNNGTITCCLAKGGNVSGYDDIGGLVGNNYSGTITNCYTTNTVSGHTNIGCLVGYNRGTITNCYSTGNISWGSEVGDLVGFNIGIIKDSFWDIQSKGNSLTGCSNCTAITTAQMKMAITYVGWVPDAVWTIDEGIDYPKMWWEDLSEKLIINPFGEGTGTQTNPYLIYTAEQFNNIGMFPFEWGKHFKLMADIDLNGLTGTEFNIIGYYIDLLDNKPFTGIFDGNGHKISNFNYTSTNKNNIGLFGSVYAAQIKNVGLINPHIDAGTGDYVGSLVGRLTNGTITGCYVESGSVEGSDQVGGLVGYSIEADITDCVSSSRVSGSQYIGGLAGMNGGNISDCNASGDITGKNKIGGLVGYNSESVSITRTYFTGSVIGTDKEIGGLVGQNKGSITNCDTYGNVSGSEQVGGLVGYNEKTEIIGCTSLARVSGNKRIGGLVGNNRTTMKYCYAAGDVSGNDEIGGLVGNNIGSISDCNTSSMVTGGDKAGGLAGKNTGKISTCYSTESVVGNNIVGGLLGQNDGTITDCHTTSHVDGNVNIGGLVGQNNFGTITNCYTKDNSISGNQYIGGLVGHHNSGTITNCYTTDNSILGNQYTGGLVGLSNSTIVASYTTSVVDGNDISGGLVGQNNYMVTKCYSSGLVTGNKFVGGLLGRNNGTIINSYTASEVTGNEIVGGLAGINDDTVINCYSISTVSGINNVGGLLGSNNIGLVIHSFWDTEISKEPNSAGGTGKITSEMQTEKTFIGWGLGLAWKIREGIDYPRLLWESIPGTPITNICTLESVSGSGSETDPFLIYTAEQLNMIALFPINWNGHFKLMADLDLNTLDDTHFNVIGTKALPFTGVFNGNNKIISNLKYSFPGKNYVGLFRCVSGQNARINDLDLIDPNIDTGTGNSVGSLVGCLERNGTVIGCSMCGGRVSGGQLVGGLVGESSGTITNCSITGIVDGNEVIGGLVGENNGSITKCYNTGIVSGRGNKVGGLVGFNFYGSISISYSIGSVTGFDYVGGLVGENDEGNITASYSTGMVSGMGNYVGGLIGRNWDWIASSFWDTETSGQATSDGGIGKTTAEMQTAKTFLEAGWDFDDIWWIDEGQGYPRLWWELIPEN